MTEAVKDPWYRRWFGGVGRREYLHALPFCVGVLVVPLLPMFWVMFVAQQGRAIIAIALLIALTFGFPILRVKRPRAAYWVGVGAAVLSTFGLLLVNVLSARFFGFYTLLTWAIAIAFTVLNWNKLRWWTFAAVAVLVLIHMVPMGLGDTVLSVGAMALMALYFRLPDRDNFPRAPLVVSVMLGLLLAHGYNFYFDLGGGTDLKNNPAVREVFAYHGQRGGWASIVGGNTRFMSPSCDGTKFYIGSKFSFRSGLTIYDPATNQHQTIPIRGGTTDNLALVCNPERIFIGNMGGNQVSIYDPAKPRQPATVTERMDGVRVGLLRLDPVLGRLYVAASNTKMLHVLRAGALKDMGYVEVGSPITDIAIDRNQNREVIVITMAGELVRLGTRGTVIKRAKTAGGLLFYNLALDGKNRRLFVTSMLGRTLSVYNADTFEPMAQTPLMKGGRYMQFDDKRGLVYVANFFMGTITAYDSAELKVRWSLKVGRRVRYLVLDHLRDQLCFTSQAGGYCLALEKLSPAPAATAETPTPSEEMAATPAEEEPTAEPETTPVAVSTPAQ